MLHGVFFLNNKFQNGVSEGAKNNSPFEKPGTMVQLCELQDSSYQGGHWQGRVGDGAERITPFKGTDDISIHIRFQTGSSENHRLKFVPNGRGIFVSRRVCLMFVSRFFRFI